MPNFEGVVRGEGLLGMSRSFSPDRQAVTILFDGLFASVEPAKGGPLIATRTLTLQLPLQLDDAKTSKSAKVSVHHDIRGAVMTTGKARATLIVRTGGKSFVIDPKKSESKPTIRVEPTEAGKELAQQAKETKKALSEQLSENESFDFFHRIEAKVSSTATHRITLVLLVERDTSTENDGGVLWIDSIDAEVKKAKK